MASYSQIRNGSRGEDVRTLQELLNQNGYNLATDGIFGRNTEAAVRDYQNRNNLAVDGIAGPNTWGALTSPAAAADEDVTILPDPDTQQAVTGTTPSKSVADFLADYNTRPTYTQSAAVTDALNRLTAWEANQPGDYQSNYAAQIDSVLNNILNRPDFSYDFATDPVYQHYADRYQELGQMAMRDTMANAAALTGGYGNTYAQNVGAQAYHSYLHDLNAIIPELQDAAYARYRDQGDDMVTNLTLLQGLDQSDYSRYRDDVADYNNMLNYYLGRYQDERDTDYGRFQDQNQWFTTDRDYWFDRLLAEQDQQNWQTEFDYAVEQDALDRALAAAAAGGAGGTGGSSGSSGGSSSGSGSGSSGRGSGSGGSSGNSQSGGGYDTAISRIRYYSNRDQYAAYLDQLGLTAAEKQDALRQWDDYHGGSTTTNENTTAGGSSSGNTASASGDRNYSVSIGSGTEDVDAVSSAAPTIDSVVTALQAVNSLRNPGSAYRQAVTTAEALAGNPEAALRYLDDEVERGRITEAEADRIYASLGFRS